MPAPPSSAERDKQGFEVAYVDETEGEVRMPLAEAGAVPFERVPAVREFPSYRGQLSDEQDRLWAGQHSRPESRMARALYEMKGRDGKRKYTVQQIADRFGVGRATIYRNLDAEPT
ncbi:helix-turn-helix domain-containing protein [Streptosporangium roseum]|uniref:helix-turn-helix domain-containing protein n=1 Tax=Streptosporangium roseum TaxID=2001 RepID=UPI003325464D